MNEESIEEVLINFLLGQDIRKYFPKDKEKEVENFFSYLRDALYDNCFIGK